MRSTLRQYLDDAAHYHLDHAGERDAEGEGEIVLTLPDGTLRRVVGRRGPLRTADDDLRDGTRAERRISDELDVQIATPSFDPSRASAVVESIDQVPWQVRRVHRGSALTTLYLARSRPFAKQRAGAERRT